MAKNKRVYLLEPQGLLDLDPGVQAHKGKLVQKVTVPGCPPNGTMRQCYVQTVQGEFIGLVNEASLVPTRNTMVPVDRAAEARDRRSPRAPRERNR